MKIVLKPNLILKSSNGEDGNTIDLYLLRNILWDITEGHTLLVAARRSKINYRKLNALITLVERTLKTKLVDRVKGHGTLLTNEGEKLLEFLNLKGAQFADISKSYQDELFAEVSAVKAVQGPKWVFYSSSDPIIQGVVSELGVFDLKIAGSGESLDRLFSGDADIAGYHVSSAQDSRIIYARLVKKGMEIYPVMKRTQGFITKKGNPFGIEGIDDLSNPKIRFINRQIGSGTRLLLDSLLIENNIDPTTINGYLHEEYTHSAIATAILANKADVGLGVKNIAVTEKLGFIPIKDEIFFLAVRKGLSSELVISRLIRKIRKLSSETPGYKSVGLIRQIQEWVE